MYRVSAQGVDERMRNVHYYYYLHINVYYSSPNKCKWRGESTVTCILLAFCKDYVLFREKENARAFRLADSTKSPDKVA